MSDVKELILKYLRTGSLIQIASVRGNKPWVCSVYYVVDDDSSIYWLSYPTRRHSKEIADNPNVAATVAIKTDVPVIGVQIEGQAGQVNSVRTIAKIMTKYVAKYGVGANFLKKFKLKQNKHVLYKLSPSRIVLFDEMTFGNDNSQEIVFTEHDG